MSLPWSGPENRGLPFSSSPATSPIAQAGGPTEGAGAASRAMPEAADSDLADFFDNAAVALHMVGPDGVILRANKAELELLGYAAEEYVGRPVEQFHVDRPAIRDMLARLMRGERVEDRAARLRARDGSIRHVRITSNAHFRGGRFLNSRSITVAVPGPRQADPVAEATEQRLHQILDALPAAVYTTDAAGRISYYNAAAVKLAGRHPTLGSDEWCVTWRLYHPDGTPMPHEQCPMALALRENRAIRGVEAIAERPDGSRLPILPFPTPLRDEKGDVVGAVNILIDISERKDAESRQRLLMSELNHRVKNNMQLLHALLKTSERETSEPEARAVLADIAQRVGSIAAAQKVLYDAASPSAFDAVDFLREVCNNALSAVGRDVDIEIAPVAGKLANDISLPLAMTLNELLVAARDDRAARGRRGVRVELREAGDDLVLSVTGAGIGFSPGGAQRRSSGLGLVERLARQMGGRFEFDHSQGARCAVRFPKSRAYGSKAGAGAPG